MKGIPRDLIEQAHHLATEEPRRPKQASLRRAVSAAYYAVFQAISCEFAALLPADAAAKARPG